MMIHGDTEQSALETEEKKRKESLALQEQLLGTLPKPKNGSVPSESLSESPEAAEGGEANTLKKNKALSKQYQNLQQNILSKVPKLNNAKVAAKMKTDVDVDITRLRDEIRDALKSSLTSLSDEKKTKAINKIKEEVATTITNAAKV